MKTISVTVCGILQVDVNVKDPEDNSEVLGATIQTITALNETLASQHTNICPILFTGGLDISDLVIATGEEDEL